MMHQRNLSNSIRVAIPQLQQIPVNQLSEERHNSASAASKRKNSHGGQERPSGLLRLYAAPGRSNTASPPTAANRTSQARGRLARLTVRQIYLLVVLCLIGYLLLSRSDSRYNSKTPRPFRPKTRYTASGEPIVDRSVLDKLRDIELQAGYIDEDLEEARNADRMAPRRGSDSPAPLYRLPDTRAKPKPAKVSTEELEALRQEPLVPREELDPLFCPDQPEGCKFLSAAWIGEQETKAQMHLYQLGLLARSLHRILVLPNVAKSRMMSCAKEPFNFYYAEDALDRLGFRTISFEKVAEWSSKRALAPTAQIVSIVNGKSTGPAQALEVDRSAEGMSVPTSPKRKLCLEQPKTYLDFSHFSPMTAYAPPNFHRSVESRAQFGEMLVNTLSSQQAFGAAWRGAKEQQMPYLPASASVGSLPNPDILVVNYELRFPILTAEQVNEKLASQEGGHLSPVQPFSHFAYAPVWAAVGSQLAASLSPFIAVHWRQESLPPDITAPCGSALIDKLVGLVTEGHKSVKVVYLATDYPIDDLRSGRDGVQARSGTFGKQLTEEHHLAMTAFLREFQVRLTDPHGVRLATLESEQESIQLSSHQDDVAAGTPRQVSTLGKMDVTEMDAGIVAIIDKTVSMHAEMFLAGESRLPSTSGSACGKYSSFTRQISEARQASRAQGGENVGALWNDIGFWSRSS